MGFFPLKILILEEKNYFKNLFKNTANFVSFTIEV